MFIELETASITVRKVLVNINAIKLIHPNDGDCNTLIEFTDGELKHFTDSYDRIIRLIEQGSSGFIC